MFNQTRGPAVGLEAAKLPNRGWSGFRLGKASRGPPASQGPGRLRNGDGPLGGVRWAWACSEGLLRKSSGQLLCLLPSALGKLLVVVEIWPWARRGQTVDGSNDKLYGEGLQTINRRYRRKQRATLRPQNDFTIFQWVGAPLKRRTQIWGTRGVVTSRGMKPSAALIGRDVTEAEAPFPVNDSCACGLGYELNMTI